MSLIAPARETDLELTSCRRVTEVVAAAEAWALAVSTQRARQLADLRERAAAMRDELQRLGSELDALEREDAELAGQPAPQLEAAAVASVAVRERLAVATDALVERQEDVLLALSEREVAVEEALIADAELGRLAEEIEAFDAAATKASLPEAYWQVVRDHHTARVSRVATWRAQQLAVPLELDVDPVDVDVVVTVRAVPGQPQQVRVLLPVAADAAPPGHPAAALGETLVALAHQQLHQLVRDGGDVPALPRRVQDEGRVALDSVLPARFDATLAEEVCARISEACAASPTLGVARLRVAVAAVPTTYLSPPRRGGRAGGDLGRSGEWSNGALVSGLPRV